MPKSLCVWTCEGKNNRSPDALPFSKAGRMAEMMAGGVEADMSFRDCATPEIRRRGMMDGRQQVDGLRAMAQVTKRPSVVTKSVHITLHHLDHVMCLLSTSRTAEASRKTTNTISVRVLIQEKQNNDKENKESYFCDAGPSRARGQAGIPPSG